MLFVMLFLTACFIGMVIYVVGNFVRQIEQQARQELSAVEGTHENLVLRKQAILIRKLSLEKEAARIFMLYEITKEITKKSSGEQAFEIFKEEIKEHVIFDDCQFVDITAGDFEHSAKTKDYFIFPLIEKRRKLGHLLFKGLREEEKDRALILSHQFALALRRVKLYQEIEQLAIKDSLTGVYTRRYFLERLDEELRRSTLRKMNLSLLMVDVDHFKNFNDQYGHLVGDHILKTVGEIMRGNVREIDIIGRYGGEEFCVALPDTDRQGANFAAERIRLAVQNCFITAYDTQVQVTVSIGISTFPLDTRVLAELMDKADWALYRAKKQGRNRICAFGIYEG